MSTPGAAGGRRRNRGSAALVVEADDAYRAVIETCVGLAGCRAETVADLAGAVPRLAGERFDVLVWGTGPDDDGLAEAVSRLRASTEAQLVLLTDHFEAVQPAGETGADHVLPKPFVPSALVGALKVAMRRSPSLIMHLASRIEIKGMSFDGHDRTLQFGGANVSFTSQEWDLMAVFLSHPNRFLAAREIIRLGWRGGTHEADQLRIYVRRLRQKLDPLGIPCRLVSQHNRGYCLVVE